MVAEWYYAKDKRVSGPVEAAELKRLAATGALDPDDLIRKTGMKQWVRASKAQELFPPNTQLTAPDSSCSVVRPAPEADAHSVEIPVFCDASRLPRVVAGLSLDQLRTYPNPDLGISIRYGAIDDNAQADVYIYDYGETHISEDLGAEQAMRHFTMAVADVVKLAEKGHYLDFELLSQSYLFVPQYEETPCFLWASFAYSHSPGEGVIVHGRRVSHLALRTDHGYYNKIRYTNMIDSNRIGFVKFLQFACEWTDFVQAQPHRDRQ